MDTLTKLTAIQDIKALKARYFKYVDGKKWKEWGDLFTDDIVAAFPSDHPGMNTPTFRGRKEFVDNVSALLEKALTIHHGHTPELEILSPNSAKGIWCMQDWLHWPDGGPFPAGYQHLIGWGHYHEAYRKEADGWRIATLTLTRVHLDIWNGERK